MTIKANSIVLVDTNSIIPNPKNNNKHSVEQIKRLEKIIKHNGFRVPMIVSNQSGFLIAGHGRLQASLNLGLEKIPVIFQDFKNDAEEYQFLTADNAIQAWSEMDMDNVLDFMAESDLDFDSELLGVHNFNILNAIEDEKEAESEEKEKKFLIEVQFSNDMDMMDIYDDLLSKGYMVKVK